MSQKETRVDSNFAARSRSMKESSNSRAAMNTPFPTESRASDPLKTDPRFDLSVKLIYFFWILLLSILVGYNFHLTLELRTQFDDLHHMALTDSLSSSIYVVPPKTTTERISRLKANKRPKRSQESDDEFNHLYF